MKVLLTGGGTGGHFYPIIAIAQELNQIAKQNRLLQPEIFYMSTEPYNEGLLFENNITFEKISAGKIRRKISIENIILNFIDLFKTALGIFEALWRIYLLYPDVVFGKGGYASFPAIFAARILFIPVVIHESDSQPGKVNAWAGKFARRIALSYPDAAKFFPKDKTAYTGNPVRREIQEAQVFGSHEFFNLNKDIPTILILGGSQGAKFINEAIMDVLPKLLENYQIIHQVGKNNIKVMEETRNVILQDNPNKDRYKVFPYLDALNLRMAAGASDLVISRAGSAIFEIALWGKPSIIIPIPEPTSHDQRTNAYSYARSGGAIVIEERNLAKGIFVAEIYRILSDKAVVKDMGDSAKAFSRADSARLIAQEITAIALEHEK